MKTNTALKLFFFVLLAVSLACAMTGTDAEANPASTSIQNTQAALDATLSALNASQTEAAAVTPTSLPTKYPTAIPSATPTAGPVVINDDFSSDVGRWSECTVCGIGDGVFYFGPNEPDINYGGGYVAICDDCGYVENYKMGVDVTYLDGPSDRGFGLVLWENDGNYIDVELTTWNYYGLWYFAPVGENGNNLWYTIIPDKGFVPSSALRAGRLTNRVEVEVSDKTGTRMATVSINGKVVQTFEMRGGPGRVGLVVGFHSIMVTFDNFYFEGMPVKGGGSSGDNG